jgi:SAM-dependent methyltransferase
MDAASRHLPQILRLKYGPIEERGWTPGLREKFGYCSPDDWYEATLFDLIDEQVVWLDVGCGRNIFPFNRPAAEILANRCKRLVGLDPSDNILANTLVHERARCMLEDYRTDLQFDLITLRMVAEHIAEPGSAVTELARLCKPGGLVVVYTVLKWSPVPLIAAITPFPIHVLAKRLLWESQEKDTFPTAYRMNTRADLLRVFAQHGFTEQAFQVIDDCRSFSRWKPMHRVELTLWKALRAMGLRYPEACILAQYRKEIA